MNQRRLQRESYVLLEILYQVQLHKLVSNDIRFKKKGIDLPLICFFYFKDYIFYWYLGM